MCFSLTTIVRLCAASLRKQRLNIINMLIETEPADIFLLSSQLSDLTLWPAIQTEFGFSLHRPSDQIWGAGYLRSAIASPLKSALLLNPLLSRPSPDLLRRHIHPVRHLLQCRFDISSSWPFSIRWGGGRLKQNLQTLQSAHPPEPKVQHMWM